MEKESDLKHSHHAMLAHRARLLGDRVIAKIHNTIAGIYRPSNSEDWAAGYIVEDDIDDDN